MDDRKYQILKLVVKEYNKNFHPVSSSNIANYIDLSAPTLRNEFRDLEKDGFIKKISSSSGRVPTEKAYLLIIENTHDIKDDSQIDQMKLKIDDLFKKRNNLIEGVLEDSLNLLNTFTKTITLTKKDNQTTKLTDIKIYDLENHNSNLIFIFSNGEIYNQIFPTKLLSKNVRISLGLIIPKLLDTKITNLTNKIDQILFKTKTNLEEIEESFLEIVKALIDKLVAKPEKLLNVNSLVNYFENKEDIMFLKNLLYKLENESVWELIQNNSIKYGESTNISLNIPGDHFKNNSLVKKDFDLNGTKKTFYFLGHKNQNYDDILKILDFIEMKIKKI